MQNKEKYALKKNNSTRQYLRNLTIYLRSRSCNNFTIHTMKKYKLQ